MTRGDLPANRLMFEHELDYNLFLNFWDKYMSEMAELKVTYLVSF